MQICGNMALMLPIPNPALEAAEDAGLARSMKEWLGISPVAGVGKHTRTQAMA